MRKWHLSVIKGGIVLKIVQTKCYRQKMMEVGMEVSCMEEEDVDVEVNVENHVENAKLKEKKEESRVKDVKLGAVEEDNLV